jgi:hypothetical protein
MPEHRTITRVPSHDITDADLAIEIRADGQLLGDLVIRRGSVDWHAGGHQYAFKMGWELFDRVMRENGKPHK